MRPPLERLRTALAEGDLTGAGDALARFDAIGLEGDDRRRVDRLRELVDGYEYDEAGAAAAEFLAALTGGAHP